MDSRIEKLQSCLAQFRQMPEASMLIEYRSRQNRLTFDDRMAVTRCIEKTFAPVFLDMRAESPSLSESDLIFCALPGTEGPNRYGPDPNVITQP